MKNLKSTKMGKNLIDILMFSIYSDYRLIYREYVQNASDAIREAVSEGVLSDVGDGYVNITINPTTRNISIVDNGIGISDKKAYDRLCNIADSYKDGENYAGQYGIGRLVGLQCCNTLVFKTSYLGESTYTKVTFDGVKAKSILNDPKDHRDAVTVMRDIISIENGEEESNAHYFETNLLEVLSDYNLLLDEDSITEYLCSVAPLDFRLQFKNLLMESSLKEEDQKYYDAIPYIKLDVNNNSDLRKNYDLTIEGTTDPINSLQFEILEDPQYGKLAWIWYAITPLTKAIPSTDKNRGLRLRKHNIQVGNENTLKEYFKEDRGNNYFYGEVHILHNLIRPNTDRNNLAPSPQTEAFKKAMHSFCDRLQDLYYLASNAKKALKDISLGYRASQIETDDHSQGQNLYEDGISKLKRLKTRDICNTTPGQKILEIYDDKAKNIIDNSKNENAPTVDSGQSGTKQKSQEPEKVVTDIFQVLEDKYSKNDIKLIRRIFASLSKNCPANGKLIFDQMKKKTLKEISK